MARAWMVGVLLVSALAGCVDEPPAPTPLPVLSPPASEGVEERLPNLTFAPILDLVQAEFHVSSLTQTDLFLSIRVQAGEILDRKWETVQGVHVDFSWNDIARPTFFGDLVPNEVHMDRCGNGLWAHADDHYRPSKRFETPAWISLAGRSLFQPDLVGPSGITIRADSDGVWTQYPQIFRDFPIHIHHASSSGVEEIWHFRLAEDGWPTLIFMEPVDPEERDGVLMERLPGIRMRADVDQPLVLGECDELSVPKQGFGRHGPATTPITSPSLREITDRIQVDPFLFGARSFLEDHPAAYLQVAEYGALGKQWRLAYVDPESRSSYEVHCRQDQAESANPLADLTSCSDRGLPAQRSPNAPSFKEIVGFDAGVRAAGVQPCAFRIEVDGLDPNFSLTSCRGQTVEGNYVTGELAFIRL